MLTGSRGYSLSELVVVMALILLGLGLTFANLRFSTAKAEGKALAQVVTEELKAARQHAMSSGVPVGVGIPTNTGSTSHSRSIYLLEGEVRPKVVRVVNFATEFENSDIFVGQWSLDTAALKDPTATNTVTQPAVAGGFTLADWEPPFPDDHLLVFTPAGTVITSGLVNFDGSFHLVVCQGVEYSGSPGSLTRVASPQTIAITPEGGISNQLGLTAGAAGLTVDGTIASAAPGIPPALAAATNDAPVFIEINRYPRGHGSYRPPGVDVMVDEDGFATLETFADDSNGDDLYCRWTCDSGFLSKQGWIRMQWDRESSRWLSVWNWRPDPNDPIDHVSTLTCEVKDSKDVVAATIAAATKKIQKTSKGRIAFGANMDGDPEIYIMNGDGSGLTQLTFNDKNDYYPDLSQDGSMITWISFENDPNGQLMIMNSDGTEQRVVNHDIPFGEPEHPQFSPDGTKIVWLADEGMHHHIIVTSLPGGPGSSIDMGDLKAEVQHPTWSPDGNRLYFACGDNAAAPPEDIAYLEYPGDAYNNPTVVVDQAPGSAADTPSISPTGELVYRVGSPGTELRKVPIDLSSPPSTIYTGSVNRPNWNPEGNRILFNLGSRLHTIDPLGGDLKTVTLYGASDASWSK